jgi:hypothetical protein
MTREKRAMPRLKQQRYQKQLMLAMSVYVAVMFFVWPLVRTVNGWPKGLIALAPLLPMLYVIALMARRIRDSDELEQRTHLIGLGVSTAVVGALSLAGGFLASAQVLALDGSILIWVFPLMMAIYGFTRWIVARQYSADFGCDSADSLALHWWVAMPVIILLSIALMAWLKRDAFHAGILVGLAVVVGVAILVSRTLQRRRRNDIRRAGRHGH